MSGYYVLLDAMGIQQYVFETNRLTVIVGASYGLSRWQRECAEKWKSAVISSAGGNVLARFDDTPSAEGFKKAAKDLAPRGLEIAWAITEDKGKDNETWQALQKEIGRYKCGDQDVPYPSPSALIGGRSGCLFCGIRTQDEKKTADGRRICSVCWSHHEQAGKVRDSGGCSPLEKLYSFAKDKGLSEAFPMELEDLVRRDDDSNDLLAVVVIDLNGMGTRVRQVVTDKGFEGLKNFSRDLEDLLYDIWSEVISEVMKSSPGMVTTRWFRMRPLLMGGDDMVFALPAFLWPQIVTQVLKKFHDKGYPACAGVVVSSHNFPISRLINMAEGLVTSGKGLTQYMEAQNKPGESAVDWHYHHEAAFSSPLSARRHRYLMERGTTVVEGATMRPYTLTDFEALLGKGDKHLNSLSTRKLRSLYESLRQGMEPTRDTLVQVFLRDELKGFKKYSGLWDLVSDEKDSTALWKHRSITVDGKPKEVWETSITDMLELMLMQKEKE
jgi:hypothetical protein